MNKELLEKALVFGIALGQQHEAEEEFFEETFGDELEEETSGDKILFEMTLED